MKNGRFNLKNYITHELSGKGQKIRGNSRKFVAKATLRTIIP